MAEVDPVILKLEAQLGTYNKDVAGAANVTEQSLKRIAGASSQTEKVMGLFGGTTKAAANDAAVGLNTLTTAARGNTVAMRETLVVARELAVGNLTRLPGSLSILAQQFAISGKSGLGFASQILQSFGIVKKSIDAGAAAEATAAAAAAQNIRTVVEKAEANIAAADTEAALARAQITTAATANELTAAQARLAAAHEAMTAAAGEASVAELALAEAEGRAAVASEAAAATVTTSFGVVGLVLLGVATAAGFLFGAFKTMQSSLRSDHTLDDYANSLGLTTKEMRKLREEVGGLSEKEMRDLNARAAAFALTWGDVFEGLKKATEDAFDLSSAWQSFKTGTADAYKSGLLYGEAFAAGSYGVVVGTFRSIEEYMGPGGTLVTGFANFFRTVENLAIEAWNTVGTGFASAYNGIIGEINTLTGNHLARAVFDPTKIVPMAKETGIAAGKSFGENVADATAEAQAKIAKNVDTIWSDIIGAAENRIKKTADSIVADRNPKKAKKVSDHGNAQALAELDAQIQGQWKLAAAYQISDAAAIKAEALQKAEEQAIRHKGEVGIYYEKELRLAVAQRAADGAKVIDDLHAQATAHKQVNDLVEAGLLPVSQMSAAVELESQKRQLLAALAIAQENGWLDKIKEIKAEIQGLITSEHDLTVEMSRQQALQAIEADTRDIEKLKLETAMMGASNRERAVAIAQLEAIQKLRDMPGLTPKEQTDFINAEVGKALAGLQTPLQQWAAQIPQTADAMNEALQKVAANGLDALTSGITDAITGTKSLGQVFHDVAGQIVADLVRIAVQQEIVQPLAKALFPNYAGGGGTGGLLGSLAGLFGGGSGSGLTPGDTTSFAGYFATGGTIPTGGFGIVGDAGPEPVFSTPAGVRVLPNSAMRIPNQRLSASAAQASVVRVEVAEGQLFEPRVTQISGNVSVQIVRAAQPALTQAAVAETFRQSSRPRM